MTDRRTDRHDTRRSGGTSTPPLHRTLSLTRLTHFLGTWIAWWLQPGFRGRCNRLQSTLKYGFQGSMKLLRIYTAKSGNWPPQNLKKSGAYNSLPPPYCFTHFSRNVVTKPTCRSPATPFPCRPLAASRRYQTCKTVLNIVFTGSPFPGQKNCILRFHHHAIDVPINPL